MSNIPRDNTLDSTLAMKWDGYLFISKRCQRLQTDVFQTRLLLQPTICMLGEEAAQIFYDTHRFQRQGAAPSRMMKTLFGVGGVQGLDGEAHRHRKQMFMSLMSAENIQQLADLTQEQWQAYSKKWATMTKVSLFDEVQELLCRAVCAWAGVFLEESEVRQRTADLAAMIEASGAVGLKHWSGRWSRKRTEEWVGNIINNVRNSNIEPPEQSALYVIAWHRGLDGELLASKIAAVELINVLRPTLAIGRFIIFLALALHEHPEQRQNLLEGEEDYYQWFVQEVRRFYPFFPAAAARVKEEFKWKGYRFPKGIRVLLDLYGTNHDARIWEEPEKFQPERFRQWDESAFNFIPQGGGDHDTNHRCPGEWITLELMKVALKVLTQSISYTVPEQNLKISLSQMPTLPKSRFVISDVRPLNNAMV
jgi:fatty-acid peroxygenase